MGSFGSKAETPQEQMKSYKREVDRAVRELDRERTKMERQNERLAMDIRKAAKNNQVRRCARVRRRSTCAILASAVYAVNSCFTVLLQTAVVKIMAKDYVRVKR